MKNVSFYNSDNSIEQKRKMAAALMEQSKPEPTQVVNGWAVPQSPLSGLAKALTQGVGGVVEGQADQAEQSKQENARKTMADALEAYSRSQAGGSTQLQNGESINWNKAPLDNSAAMYQNILMNNPDTAPYGMQASMATLKSQQDQQLENMKYQRERSDKNSDWEKDAQLKRELAALRSGSGGWEVDPETGETTFVPATETVSDPTALANAIGVPAAPIDTRNMSPKDASIYAKNTRLNAEKRLQGSDMTEAASKARANLKDAQRFKDLMKEQKTGGLLVNTPIVGGLMKKFDPELNEMQSIQDRLTPQQRAPGSGSTSNFDAQMFSNALFGPNKPAETNEAIIRANEEKSQDELNYQSFLSDFLQANGHLNGSDKAWQQYLDDNPIFDPSSPRVPKINASRKSYHEYFGTAQAPQAESKTINGVTYIKENGQWYQQ